MSEVILAIDWSSTRLSVGWKLSGKVEERVLDLKRFQAELALPFLEGLLAELPVVNEIRLGRGPGNYSGIRQSLAWAFGYIAPGGIELKVFSSGVAQAARISDEIQTPFAVLGDARRGVWWGRVFGKGEDGWRLQSPEAWAEELGEIPVFSQEAPRLSSAPFEIMPDYPKASDLLLLSDDFSREEALPLYLHPAV
ncbi:hypothetical protein P0Y35_18145 [Kiritimatiellaeota bacterium B1221]|nr:hypothetical protein [Kiritimatiellaeota bacterium B1221]